MKRFAIDHTQFRETAKQFYEFIGPPNGPSHEKRLDALLDSISRIKGTDPIREQLLNSVIDQVFWLGAFYRHTKENDWYTEVEDDGEYEDSEEAQEPGPTDPSDAMYG